VFVSERQKELIFSFALGNMSEAELLREFPWSSEEKASLGIVVLDFALSHRDADAVEAGLVLADLFGMDGRHIPILERLAGEDWHRQHEDIVFALGKLASPTSVEVIYEAARSRNPYLQEYDDSFELRSKCIHALGNIGTVGAVRRLERLHELLEDSQLQAKIVRRLRELASDGASEEVRAEARMALGGANTQSPRRMMVSFPRAPTGRSGQYSRRKPSASTRPIRRRSRTRRSRRSGSCLLSPASA
jgi:hypothetical protein